MKAGDCFHGCLPNSGKIPHYWVVLADPCSAGFVPLVNFTTPTGAPMAHIVTQASFPVLKYDSEVAWGYADIRPASAIEAAIKAGLFVVQKSMSAAELVAVLRGGSERGLISRQILKKLAGK